jgi:PAS domain S-box-containing protein
MNELSIRIEAEYGRIMGAIRERTDHMFAGLMAVQWLFGIAIASVVSPYGSSGNHSNDAYMAFFVGGAISILPIALALLNPGGLLTRHTMAIAQMLWSALFIHLTGGRIETHFHVFASLAILAFYRDSRVLISAFLAISADHLIGGMLWPESVYGVANPEWWRFLEHGLWIAFESVFLMISIRNGRGETRALARQQVELETASSGVETQVDERTAELASSREQYRSLLETTQAIPWELDLNSMRFTYVGPQASQIVGYSVSEWTAKDFLASHVHADDHGALARLTKIEKGKAETEVEFRLLAASGQWVWVRNIVGIAEDKKGRQVLRGIMLDVNERKKLESELAQAQKLESIGRLASGIAHEINTPVQFVSDSVHFVREGARDIATLIEKYQMLHRVYGKTADPELAADITQMEESVDLPYLLERMPKALDRALEGLRHVAVIVRSMKEFAHPNQKAKTAVDLNQAIISTLAIARNECKYVAQVDTDFGELPDIPCYSGEVNQAVLNILVNASHAIADRVRGTDEMGRIGVRTWRQNDYAVIAISDTGGGIPKTIRSKIFDPFFTTKDVGRGTGQGLAIARSIVVDKHGGTLDYETELGRGTTFFIRLPIHDVPVSVSVA